MKFEQKKTVGVKGRPPQVGPLWHEDHFALKCNQNPADSGKSLYLLHSCLKEGDLSSSIG